MKKLIRNTFGMLMIASLFSSCVVYDPYPHPHPHRHHKKVIIVGENTEMNATDSIGKAEMVDPASGSAASEPTK